MNQFVNPDFRQSSEGRFMRSGREPQTNTRCNFMIDGKPCGRFPSFPVLGNHRQRRCEEHRDQ